MTFELSILLKATAVLILGLTAARLCHRARASVRHLLLASTFGALLVLPIVAALVPAVVVEVPVAGAARMATPEHPTSASRPQPVTHEPDGGASPVPGGRSMSTVTMLRVGWGLGTALLLATLAGSLWNLRRIRRSGIPWIAGEASARALAAGGGIRRHLTVVLHEHVGVPVTCGLMRPAIVLPADARAWAESDLQRAFVHELEHVRRADWWVHLAARAICAAYWFHPLVWIAWRQLGLESERACDDAVVGGTERTDYAEQLVTLAARLSKAQVQPMLSMANRSDLSVRVRAVLDATQLRGRPGVMVAAATFGVVALVVATIAPLRAVAVSRGSSLADATQQTARRDAVTSALNVALIEAAGSGDHANVAELLDRGGQVNAVVSGDGSPLIVAARAGRRQVVRLLLERGADPDLAVPGDGSPLIMAAREGHLDIVTTLLDRGAVIDRIVEEDENALIQASAEGRLEVVKLLVARGANVNVRAWVLAAREQASGEWRTPLNMARRNRHNAVVTYLLSAGAVE